MWRSEKRVANFFADLNEKLGGSTFVAGDHYSVADITAMVTVDFARGALSLTPADDQTALLRWYEAVSTRPSSKA